MTDDKKDDDCPGQPGPDKDHRKADRRGPGRRAAKQDRRTGTGRRKVADPSYPGSEQRKGERRDVLDRRTGLDRRRGPGRRRTEARRSAEEGEMTAEQFEFLQAINEYKQVNKRPFPTWTEVLDVMKALGYRKVSEPVDIRET